MGKDDLCGVKCQHFDVPNALHYVFYLRKTRWGLYKAFNSSLTGLYCLIMKTKARAQLTCTLQQYA